MKSRKRGRNEGSKKGMKEGKKEERIKRNERIEAGNRGRK